MHRNIHTSFDEDGQGFVCSQLGGKAVHTEELIPSCEHTVPGIAVEAHACQVQHLNGLIMPMSQGNQQRQRVVRRAVLLMLLQQWLQRQKQQAACILTRHRTNCRFFMHLLELQALLTTITEATLKANVLHDWCSPSDLDHGCSSLS